MDERETAGKIGGTLGAIVLLAGVLVSDQSIPAARLGTAPFFSYLLSVAGVGYHFGQSIGRNRKDYNAVD